MSATAYPTVASQTAAPRRWPALVLVALGLVCYFGIRVLVSNYPVALTYPGVLMGGMFGPLACAVLLALYWLFLGQAPLMTRLVSLLVAALVALGGLMVAHPYSRQWLVSWGIPAALGAVALFLCAFWWAGKGARYVGALVVGLAALSPWAMVRMNGVWGAYEMDWDWRWSLSADQRTDRNKTGESITLPPAGPNDWPGFRGAERAGVSPGKVGAIDAGALKEAWRVKLGQGWGSMCVVGDYVFTQDQLPEEERVACYKAATGERVWEHTEQVRHDDPMSGAGPRSTPTYHEGKLYVLGAKGALACLDAATGKPAWQVDLAEKYGAKAPFFGMSSSVLIAGGRAYVHPGTPSGGPRLLCLDAKRGEKVFAEGASANGYSSPQMATLAGVTQVLVYNDEGLFGHDPATGKELWKYEWKAGQQNPTSNQPLVLPGDRVLLGGGGVGRGSHCVQVKRSGEGWAATLAWETTRYTPNFNDVVPYQGKVYGLDSGRVFCADPESGELEWKSKASNYGTGQLLLLADALVVQAEKGDVVLLPLPPERESKGARVKALSDKTWNHPAFAHGRLFVRNGAEMVCFEVPPAGVIRPIISSAARRGRCCPCWR